ncbi:MAG TPA: hypothetical protein EYP10_10740, partial [Armatimonadetes bacterium]|nr:hypothetical protein [Armatimonadota bacterium]
DVPVNEPGVHLVTFRSNSHVKRATILITDIGLVVKENSRQVLIYAADLTSGEPIANVTVDAYLQYRRKPISLGVTDENGLINAELISHGWAEVKLIARKGNQISMMSFYMDTSPAVSKYKVHIYTDRPVYRPGHHVYFKGVVRLLNGMDFAIPKPQDVDIEVRDARGHKIWTGKARTNSFGTFFGEFDLPREVATGAAELTASIDGEEHHCSIPVAAYRKPEFTVKATAMRRDYLPGETARVKVSARYYFGVPVRNANIRYSVYRTEAWHVNYDLEDESSYWQPVDERGSLIMRGEATTDENGRAVIAIKLPRTTESKGDATEQAPDWRWIPTVWHYTVELAVEDIGGRFVERTATFYMHPSAVAITASPQAYVIHPNEPLRVKFAVRDLKGKPHKGVKVHIIYGRVIWRRLEHGWREELVSVNRASAIADSKGEAWLSIKLDAPGQWVIHATVYDNQGRKNADVAYVSVYGEGMREIPQYRYPKLELVPTKPTFEVGEMAEVLLNTSVKDGYVWLTLEAERVYRSWVLKLDSKSQLIRFRIEPRYIPGVWLCATLVRH